MTSTALAALICRRFEGLSLTAYQDPAGVWTIGRGRTHGVQPGDTCTEAQADKWLAEDIADAADTITSVIHIDGMTHPEFGALVSLAFNCGSAPFLPGTGLRDALDCCTWAAVPDEIRRWIHASGKVLPGLVKRRAVEAVVWELPDWIDTLRHVGPLVPRPLREVEALQALLFLCGNDPGPVDGLWGPNTAAALLAFQHAEGLFATASINSATVAALAAALAKAAGQGDEV